MVKWTSALFSDARNKLANQVTFSIWKGRPYMRAYVIPANPRTCKQRAHRDVFDKLVKRYQSIATDADAKAEWDKRGLEFLISGFNTFMKFGRKSELSVSPESFPTGTTYPQDVTVSYTCGIPLAEAKLYVFDQTTWTDITPAAGLSASGTVVYSVAATGTYDFYLATSAVLKAGETSPQPYQAIQHWKPDLTNCVAKACRVVAE